VEGQFSSGSVRLAVELNPAKLSEGDWEAIRASLLALGVRRPWVERFDFAIDYRVPRGLLVLDDRSRAMDCFGLGAAGPETERTGFRKGSKLKLQLYDKRAERMAKAGVDLGEDCTRFEAQVQPAGDQDTTLAGLAAFPCPLQSCTVRQFAFDPATLYDPDFAFAALAVRGCGLRTVLATAKRMGWRSDKREQFVEVVVPEVRPSPAALWAREFPRVASAAVANLIDATGVVRPSRYMAPSPVIAS
jgi:hypothetical protein